MGASGKTRDDESQSRRPEKAYLMQQAHNAIAPLEDAIDLDMATEAEKLVLLAWKKYRVLLNRVDISTAPDVEWPVPPESGDQ
ncbi:hypothetical protein SODG_004155 [Sodalis praecaptivus]